MPERQVPAPALRETAEIWWDAELAPRVEWDAEGRLFELVDAGDEANRLHLWRAEEPVTDPRELAEALAEGLAACDFPPTGDGVSEARATATLRVAGLLDR